MELNELRRIAEAATPGPWRDHGGYYVNTVPEFDLHRFDVMSEELAKCDLRQADATHIATFDPPTVLALLSRLEQAEQAASTLEQARDYWKASALDSEQAVQRVREIAAGWATNDRPFREAILRALDGDGRG